MKVKQIVLFVIVCVFLVAVLVYMRESQPVDPILSPAEASEATAIFQKAVGQTITIYFRPGVGNQNMTVRADQFISV